jgi:hypothetical protein
MDDHPPFVESLPMNDCHFGCIRKFLQKIILQEGKLSDNVTGKMRHTNSPFPSVKGASNSLKHNTTTTGILQKSIG